MNGGEFGITQLTNNDLANGRLANGRLSDCGQKVRMEYATIRERVCCRLPTCDMEKSSAFAGCVVLFDLRHRWAHLRNSPSIVFAQAFPPTAIFNGLRVHT